MQVQVRNVHLNGFPQHGMSPLNQAHWCVGFTRGNFMVYGQRVSPFSHLVADPSSAFICKKFGWWPKMGNPRPLKSSDQVASLLFVQQSGGLILGGHVDVGENWIFHATLLDPKNI